MATKTIKRAVIGASSSAGRNLVNGGQLSQKISYSGEATDWDMGWLVFDTAELNNVSKAITISQAAVSYEFYVKEDSIFGVTVRGHHWGTLHRSSVTVSGTTSTTSGSQIISSAAFEDYFNNKNEGSWTSRSKTFSLSGSQALNPSRTNGKFVIRWYIQEDNLSTNMYVYLKNVYLNLTYDEKYYARFYNNGTLEKTQTINGGSAATYYTPTRYGYKFLGWRCSADNKLYNSGSLPTGTQYDIAYAAEWELINYTITWNYNGGTTSTALTNPTTYRADSTSWNDGGKRMPSKPGYVFTGWDLSVPGGKITQDVMRGYADKPVSFTVSANSDGSTKYKLNCGGYTSSTWKQVHFGDYNVSTTDSITVTGQIRVISAPTTIALYHGEKDNDYTHSASNQVRYDSSHADGTWRRFSVTRTGYTSNVATGCIEFYTGNLNGLSGTLEFDLREIKVIKNGDTSTNLCETKGSQLNQNLTATAMYRPAIYVTYDTIFSYLKWKEYQTITGSGSTVSNITNTGFTLKANKNDAYTNDSHRFPFPIANVGSQYTIEYEKTGAANTEAFVFFHKDANTSWDSFNNGGGTATPKFNFTVTSGDTYGSLRTDVNVNGETANFSNFRIYPTNYSYMSTSLPATHRSDCETWSMTNPNARTGYTFKEWNTKPNGTGTKYTSSSIFPTSDLVLYSIWTINKYKATFLDYQGNTIETTEWNYNTTPSCSKTPTRPSDAQYHYTFAGWQNIGPITQDTTYVPIWESTIRKYNVIWYNDDGTTVLETDSIKYGDIPVYDKALPEKSDTAEWDYTFIGWKIGISNDIINPEDPFPVVVGEITYTAQYSVTKQKYTVTWLNHNGEQLGPKQEYEYGDVPVFDWMENGMPTKEEDDEYYYEFLDWDTTPGDNNASGTGPITSDIIYTAVFTAHRKKCKIILQSSPENGGTVTGAGEYQSGALVSISATPNPGYTFIQWNDGSKDTTRLINAISNITYIAEFKKIIGYWYIYPIIQAFLNTTDISNNILIGKGNN